MAAVLLAGAFGQRNPGDEALLRAFVEGLPDHALVATSVDPVHTESRHGIEAIQSRDLDFTIDQQPYLQGFLPILQLFLVLGVAADIGLDLGIIGIYAAKAVSSSKEPANVFLRLHHRF